jgi:hypothetical protein
MALRWLKQSRNMWPIRHIKHRILVVSDWYIYILMCRARLPLLSSAALCRPAVCFLTPVCVRRVLKLNAGDMSGFPGPCVLFIHEQGRTYRHDHVSRMCVLFNCY